MAEAGAAHGGEHRLKPPQRLVQIHGHVLRQGEGAYAAHGVADALHGLLRRQHFGLDAEKVLVFAVIDAGVPGGHHQNGPLSYLEAEGLGDAGGGHPQSGGRASSTVALETSSSRMRWVTP